MHTFFAREAREVLEAGVLLAQLVRIGAVGHDHATGNSARTHCNGGLEFGCAVVALVAPLEEVEFPLAKTGCAPNQDKQIRHTPICMLSTMYLHFLIMQHLTLSIWILLSLFLQHLQLYLEGRSHELYALLLQLFSLFH